MFSESLSISNLPSQNAGFLVTRMISSLLLFWVARYFGLNRYDAAIPMTGISPSRLSNTFAIGFSSVMLYSGFSLPGLKISYFAFQMERIPFLPTEPNSAPLSVSKKYLADQSSTLLAAMVPILVFLDESVKMSTFSLSLNSFCLT